MKHIALMLINRTINGEKRPAVQNENKLGAAVIYVVCHLQRWCR